MKKELLFREIQRQMPFFKDVWYEWLNDRMDVYIADKKEFYVLEEGSVHCYESKGYDKYSYNILQHLKTATKLVREYYKAMALAEEFKYPSLSQPYKLLAQYGDVVLLGVSLENDEEFNFLTWDRTARRSEQVHHCDNDYAGAKEDFAIRSGLVNENKIFSYGDYEDIHCCISEILGSDYELSDGHIARLEEIRGKIEKVIDNVKQMETLQDNKCELFM